MVVQFLLLHFICSHLILLRFEEVRPRTYCGGSFKFQNVCFTVRVFKWKGQQHQRDHEGGHHVIILRLSCFLGLQIDSFQLFLLILNFVFNWWINLRSKQVFNKCVFLVLYLVFQQYILNLGDFDKMCTFFQPINKLTTKVINKLSILSIWLFPLKLIQPMTKKLKLNVIDEPHRHVRTKSMFIFDLENCQHFRHDQIPISLLLYQNFEASFDNHQNP